MTNGVICTTHETPGAQLGWRSVALVCEAARALVTWRCPQGFPEPAEPLQPPGPARGAQPQLTAPLSALCVCRMLTTTCVGRTSSFRAWRSAKPRRSPRGRAVPSSCETSLCRRYVAWRAPPGPPPSASSNRCVHQLHRGFDWYRPERLVRGWMPAAIGIECPANLLDVARASGDPCLPRVRRLRLHRMPTSQPFVHLIYLIAGYRAAAHGAHHH